MQEINLYDLIKFYGKKWRIIVILTVAGLAGGFVFNTFIQAPEYKSDATLAVVLPSTAYSSDTTLNNYVELFKSRRVLDPVISELKINKSYEQFVRTFDISNDKTASIIHMSVVNSDQRQSKIIATNAIASFENEVKNVYNADNVRIVDGANEPSKPYNVNLLMQLVIASAAGFIVSVIGLFFAYDFKKSKQNSNSSLVNSNEAVIAQREKKIELRKKQVDDERRKKEIVKLRSEKAEFKKSARESKQAKRITDKKASARRKNIATKNRTEKITIRKSLKINELEKKAKLKQERNIDKKKARLVRIAERKDVRKIIRTNIALGIKSALFPLNKKMEEAKDVQALKYEARQAERIARHEERMAKIEDMRTSSLEKRIAARSKSTKLAVRIEKEEKIVATKNNTISQSAVAQSNANVIYNKIKATKTKHNLLNRIRRNRSK